MCSVILPCFLQMMMDEPCFDILRTREQLGYAVFCDYKNTNGIIGICVLVGTQADNFRYGI